MGYKSDAQRKAVHASKNEAAGKMKSSSKYGKKHDRLGKKAEKLDKKSMNPDKPVSDKKFNKLQDKRDKVVSKRKEIREKKDAAGKMKHGSHAKMYGKSPAKAKGHTLKKTSKPAPDTKGMKTERARSLKKTSKPAPNSMSKELTYGGPVIDQMGNALSHMGAMKVLKHSKSRM